MAKSKPKNVRGWLLFFVIIFVLAGIGEISLFFYALENGFTGMDRTLQLAFSPLLVVGFLGSAWFILAKKKVALNFVYFTVLVLIVFSVLANLMTAKDIGISDKLINIVSSLFVNGLIGLYFSNSKRIKETLQ